MAEDEIKQEDSDKITNDFIRLDAYDNTVPVVYANDTSMVVGNDDVSIVFGYNFDGGNIHQSQPSVRIVLPHSSFIQMVEYWSKRATLLRKLYDGHPIGFLETEPTVEGIGKAYDEVFKGD